MYLNRKVKTGYNQFDNIKKMKKRIVKINPIIQSQPTYYYLMVIENDIISNENTISAKCNRIS